MPQCREGDHDANWVIEADVEDFPTFDESRNGGYVMWSVCSGHITKYVTMIEEQGASVTVIDKIDRWR